MSAKEDEGLATQYLTFTLRDEDFAIEIAKVREVLDVSNLTRIPRMPDYLSGVINLRGNVVPVMDLGRKLGMHPIERTKNTCIMIVEVEVEGTVVEMGALTDSVQMVLDLLAGDIEGVPKMGTNLDTKFLKGMGHQDDKILILLDIDRVMASEGKAVLRGERLDVVAENISAAGGEEGEPAAGVSA